MKVGLLPSENEKQLVGLYPQVIASNGPVTLGRIDLTYKKRMLFVDVRFMLCVRVRRFFVANKHSWASEAYMVDSNEKCTNPFFLGSNLNKLPLFFPFAHGLYTYWPYMI